MKTILEYIMLNYTWILGGVIIILLAIIGSYADKTNFGQGKQEENDDYGKNKKSIEGKRLQDLIEEKKEISNTPVQSEEKYSSNQVAKPSFNDFETQSINNEASKNDSISISGINELEDTEEKFEEFDKEFNELLPEKEIINDDLLDEIDSLSLDKTQKLDLSDIPDLDDVELPKIKSLQSQEEDIWKF